MFDFDDKLINLSNSCEKELSAIFESVEDICRFNSLKVLKAFKKNSLSDIHL